MAHCDSGEGRVHDYYWRHGGPPSVRRLLIYQGLIAEERCIIELLRAFRRLWLDDVGLLLMGYMGNDAYGNRVDEIAKTDRRIVIAPRLAPPEHLQVAESCHAGIMLYRPDSLNNLYCAPNKLFEYAACGIGMLMPAFPHLRFLNERYGLGELCDPQEEESILRGVARLLERPRAYYKENALCFLRDCPRPEDVYGDIMQWLVQDGEERPPRYAE